jgi:hypothetical protein
MKLLYVGRLFRPPPTHDLLQGVLLVILQGEKVHEALIDGVYPIIFQLLSMYVSIRLLSLLQNHLAQRISFFGPLVVDGKVRVRFGIRMSRRRSHFFPTFNAIWKPRHLTEVEELFQRHVLQSGTPFGKVDFHQTPKLIVRADEPWSFGASQVGGMLNGVGAVIILCSMTASFDSVDDLAFELEQWHDYHMHILHHPNGVFGGCDLGIGRWSALGGEEITCVTFVENTVSRNMVVYNRHIV